MYLTITLLSVIVSSISAVSLSSLSSAECIQHLVKTISIPSESLFHKTQIAASPIIHHYLLANPSYFLANPAFASTYDIHDITSLEETHLVTKLPAIYLAETHPEYGTLGYQLNSKSDKFMGDIFPALRTLRARPIYKGGSQQKGSSFSMLHRKAGFPENRPFKVLPGKQEFQLYFSPNVAMANELISTKDAVVQDFKFFEWATNWLPGQVESEYANFAWVAVSGPIEVSAYCL